MNADVPRSKSDAESMPTNAKFLGYFLIAGYVLAPNLLLLKFVSPADWLTVLSDITVDESSIIIICQLPTLLLFGSTIYIALRKDKAPFTFVVAAFVPSAYAHAWISYWLMFIAQYSYPDILILIGLVVMGYLTFFSLLMNKSQAEGSQ